MAHYAFLNSENIVVQVIVGKDENEGDYDWEIFYGNEMGLVCKRTSFNTYGNKHLLGGTPFRKNYAGIGYTYDSKLDGFIPPKLFSSWILNEETCLWEAPIPYPQDGKTYIWDEHNLIWQEIT